MLPSSDDNDIIQEGTVDILMDENGRPSLFLSIFNPPLITDGANLLTSEHVLVATATTPVMASAIVASLNSSFLFLLENEEAVFTNEQNVDAVVAFRLAEKIQLQERKERMN
jgi:hypothetical protein